MWTPLYAITALILLLVAAQSAPAQTYTVTKLPRLPGLLYSEPYAINEHGDVVGVLYFDFGFYSAFLYSNGNMNNLGTLPGDIESVAYGINNHGQVVGESSDGIGSPRRAFLYANRKMTDLGTLPGGFSSVAYDINDSGHAGRLREAGESVINRAW